MNNIRWLRSVLITLSLCLIPHTSCLAAAPQEFKFNVTHFSVEGLSQLPQSFIDDYFAPLQNKAYTLKELQNVSKALERAIHEQGFLLYRVIVPAQTLASGDVKLQVVPVETLHCKVSK